MKINQKLNQKIKIFCILCLILLFMYSLCPTHVERKGYFSRTRRLCGMPFYIIILLAFILVFFLN